MNAAELDEKTLEDQMGARAGRMEFALTRDPKKPIMGRGGDCREGTWMDGRGRLQ